MIYPERTGKFLFGVIGFTVIVAVLAALAGPMYAESSARQPWLSQFERGPVSVTFISALPGKDRTVEARLISVESFGVVLRLQSERDKFFSYANIVSIDPK